MKKKLLVTVMGMTLAFAMLTGCGSKAEDTTTVTSASADTEASTSTADENEAETEDTSDSADEIETPEEDAWKEFEVSCFTYLICYRSGADYLDTNPKSSDGKYLWDLIYYNRVVDDIVVPGLNNMIADEFKPVCEYTDVDGEQWFQLTLDTDNFVSETGADYYVDEDGTPIGKMVFKVSPDYTKFIYKDVLFELPESAQ